jgi:hypothetical protein
MAVYRDNIHCFGCGFHRNNADESLAVLLGCTNEEAFEKLIQFQVDFVPVPKGAAPRTPISIGIARMYSRFLTEHMPERIHWLLGRGLTLDTIESQMLGHTGSHFTIPVLDQSQNLLTVRYRRDDAVSTEGPKYLGMKGRNGAYLYGEHWLSQMETDFVIVTEGEFDALLLMQYGLPACSLTNGAGQVVRIPQYLSKVFPGRQFLSVVIATDTDKPGEEAARKTAVAAIAEGVTPYRLLMVEKDATEHFKAGGLQQLRVGVFDAKGTRFKSYGTPDLCTWLHDRHFNDSRTPSGKSTGLLAA